MAAIETCARLEHVYGMLPPASLLAVQPHVAGVPPEGQFRNTYSTLSPKAPSVSGNSGLLHDDTTNDPPTVNPDKSIEYRSVPVDAGYKPSIGGHEIVTEVSQAAATGRARSGKEPRKPDP